MRYINKNQVTEFVLEESDKTTYNITIEFTGGTAIFLENKTKAECIALAEKLGLTLIDQIMEWIKIEDELPEFKTDVLCFFSECGAGILMGQLDQATYVHTKDGIDCQKDWSLYSSIGNMEYDVTHWMPLPKVPK